MQLLAVLVGVGLVFWLRRSSTTAAAQTPPQAPRPVEAKPADVALAPSAGTPVSDPAPVSAPSSGAPSTMTRGQIPTEHVDLSTAQALAPPSKVGSVSSTGVGGRTGSSLPLLVAAPTKVGLIPEKTLPVVDPKLLATASTFAPLPLSPGIRRG